MLTPPQTQQGANLLSRGNCYMGEGVGQLNTMPILLVEDNPDDVELTLRALKMNHIENEVVIARDGLEALDYLFGTGKYANRGSNGTPAVVLLDLKLPRVDGLEVLEKIRNDKRTKLIPVVILTSSREERDILNGYSLGANSYIRKPVRFEQFVSAVQKMGEYWLSQNEPVPKREVE